MPVETDADRAAFLHPEEFGSPVTWAHAGGTSMPNAIFDAPYQLALSDGDDAGVEGVEPQIRVRSVDVPPTAAHGDTVTIGIDVFDVVEIKPDGTGMTIVRLMEA